jgi:hypothetical protein
MAGCGREVAGLISSRRQMIFAFRRMLSGGWFGFGPTGAGSAVMLGLSGTDESLFGEGQ